MCTVFLNLKQTSYFNRLNGHNTHQSVTVHINIYSEHREIQKKILFFFQSSNCQTVQMVGHP